MTKIALTIAGSDCCAGAGLQADLKTFASMRVHGLSVVTSVVAESPHSVESIFPVSVENIRQQVNSLLPYYPIHAFKTGMLCNAENVQALSELISDTSLKNVPLIIDPILSSSTGSTLSGLSIVDAYKKHLFNKSTLITPNLIEAQYIIGEEIDTEDKMTQAAITIANEYQTSCLLKGGHADFLRESTDFLALANDTAKEVKQFSMPWIDIPMSHGTGCTLSAAITANLAKDQALPTAVGNAKKWLHQAIKNSLIWSHGEKDTYCINQSSI